jgi:microcystin-dependent protein
MSNCKDCTNNCPQILPDSCIVYTGDDIPALGICNGDLVSEVEKVIIDKLLTVIDGTGITLSEVTLENCTWLKGQLSGEQNLSTILQLLIDSQCTLKDLIDDLATDIVTFDTLCLSDLPDNPTPNDILQEAVRVLCNIKTTVDAIPSTYVKISDINSYISNYITSNSSVTNYYTNIPAKVALPYFGDLSKFDNTGKGIESQGFKNIYICNGQYGTPDLRGRAVVGAVKNIPGGALDSEVDPTLLANAGTNYAINDRFGKSYVGLTINQVPAHSHTITDPGHTHTVTLKSMNFDDKGTSGSDLTGPDTSANSTRSYTTSSTTTGITIDSTGGSQTHENRQPSMAAVWIMAIY